ncbi:chromate efflux transporter [Chitinimonas sp. BJYL2]|uniref:chromate efflux transporter n=1 Tax=Chitinimonas sp. BJYL2 TaxID=2976696 RepID=UPI0022B35C3A|nr:chromate efflux transporter [Chitinimonas sp. BJYL2]
MITPPPFADACRFWLKLGLISFGGPAGQIAIMREELVERRRWLDAEHFNHALAYCMLLPGPEAQQLATYAGWLLHGRRGGLVAGLLFILPSLLLMLVLGWLYVGFGDTPVASAIKLGVQPVVVALVAMALWRFGKKGLQGRQSWLLAICAFVVGWWALLPIPLLLLLVGLLGWWQRDREPDLAARPPLAFRRRLAGIAAFVGVFLAICLLLAPTGRLGEIASVCGKAALVSFGGAYAVLPYFFDTAVRDYQWITAPQMLDALALGETTPGPLIMVLSFVGYLAAAPMGWGWLGALTATLFTFLPSFVFILAGAPLVEASRHLPAVKAPLASISAAIVGLIAQLALMLALHVLWPQQQIDWLAAALALAGFGLLWRGGSVPLVLGLGLLAGMLRAWLML